MCIFNFAFYIFIIKRKLHRKTLKFDTDKIFLISIFCPSYHKSSSISISIRESKAFIVCKLYVKKNTLSSNVNEIQLLKTNIKDFSYTYIF